MGILWAKQNPKVVNYGSHRSTVPRGICPSIIAFASRPFAREPEGLNVVGGTAKERALVNQLERLVSAPRLQRYREAATTDFDIVTLYCWNILLAEALLPSLAILEVSLRNAVHNALASHTGTEFWFQSVLHPDSYNNIAGLMQEIARRQGQPPTAGKVISEISFGFWPKMFAKRYNSLWWNPQHPLLQEVIPNLHKMGRDTRRVLEIRLEYFAKLRNRCMHQEAVFQGVAALNRPVRPLVELHTELLETIGWISLDAANLASCMDRFVEVHQDGRAQIGSTLRRRFTL